MFSDKTLLITGGTGSFGAAVLDRFLSDDIRGDPYFFPRRKKTRRNAPRLSGAVRARALRQDQISHRRRARHRLDRKRHVRRGLCLSRRRFEGRCPPASFFPMEAVKTNVLGTKQRTDGRDRGRREENHLPVHGQGGLSGQRDGHKQGHDGKSRRFEIAYRRRVQNAHVLYALRKRHVLARQRDPLVRRADQGRRPFDGHRPADDAIYHVPCRGRRPRRLRV